MKRKLIKEYSKMLHGYIKTQDENNLYQAQKISRDLIKQQTSPEEMISLHITALQEVFQDFPPSVQHSYQFLLETMMGYALAYREHQVLREQQMKLQSEIAIAADMQKTLLKPDEPTIASLDIGVISIPARQMSGDYYHFVQDEDDHLGVAIADVIGKGIPAALCMSMIKYALDSLPETRANPQTVLANLNRVVEHNVDPGMFITMFYAVYDAKKHQLRYSSAGHEPGFFYNEKADEFEELEAKGLLLGVSKDVIYREYAREISVGDMMILLSDGVTECRKGDSFIERDEIVDLIRKDMELSAQEIVENVYQELERFQDFELKDDFTLIILRRKV